MNYGSAVVFLFLAAACVAPPFEGQCRGNEVFVVDAGHAADGGLACEDGWFLYDDLQGWAPAPPDAGTPPPVQRGDLRCHLRCASDADCAAGCGRCGRIALFRGTDYNGDGVDVCGVADAGGQ